MVNETGNRQYHLGVLFGTLISFCQYKIWDGIVEYAKNNNICVTAYFGTYHTSDSGFIPHYETCRQSIMNNSSLDGLIVAASSVTIDMEPDYFIEYFAKISKKIPVVFVGAPVSGSPSVLIDSEDGIYTLVNHLINDHGKKRIAFVKGPEATWEAERRFEGYKKALSENGIPYDENLILPGNYMEESGAAAAEELLDVRKLKVDAIAVSNDDMACGVLKVLKSRNIQIPSEIAVTGFDDDEISWTITPSLTTVRQDFFNLGKTGSQILCDVIEKRQVKEHNYLPTVFVPRQSCGCFDGDLLAKNIPTDEITSQAETLLDYVMQTIEPFMPKNIPHEKTGQWIASIVNMLEEKNIREDSFKRAVFEIVNDYGQYGADKTIWCDILQTLISGTLSFKDKVGNTKSSLTALTGAMALVYECLHKDRQARDYEENDFRMTIGRITNALVSSFDIDLLTQELHKSLPKLHIDAAFICLYHYYVENNDPEADRRIATVLGYDGDNIINIQRDTPEMALPFDYSIIDGFDFGRKRRTLIFYPLFFGEEELGILVLSYDTRMPMDAYAGLRIDISTAVKGASLITKIRALSVTDELTGLLNRRGFFRYAASNLKFMNRACNSQKAAVLFFDMDKLKYINDTFGHNEGDIAIVEFSKILKASLRETDVIGRLGGDEFVVFSAVDSDKCVEQLEERIRDNLEAYNSGNKHPYRISTSIGSAILKSLSMQDLEETINRADNILYEEKKQKRDRERNQQ